MVLLLKETHAMMKMVSANTAPMMVQMQSVHTLNDSSTGRFLKVYTFFANMMIKFIQRIKNIDA